MARQHVGTAIIARDIRGW